MTTYGYTRVSTTEQADNRSSLDDQARRVQGAAMMRGEGVARLFSDPGVSGAMPLSKRPGGALLLTALRRGDVVIAAKMDRMFRSASDALVTVEDLAERGVSLILADIGIEPVTENGTAKLFFSMLAAFAEFERTRIAERTDDGRRGKRARGGHVGGSAPYGYRVEGSGRDAVLIPVPEELEVVTRARVLKEGRSLRRVAAALEAEGHLSRTGGRFHPEQVASMLRQPIV